MLFFLLGKYSYVKKIFYKNLQSKAWVKISFFRNVFNLDISIFSIIKKTKNKKHYI